MIDCAKKISAGLKRPRGAYEEFYLNPGKTFRGLPWRSSRLPSGIPRQKNQAWSRGRCGSRFDAASFPLDAVVFDFSVRGFGPRGRASLFPKDKVRVGGTPAPGTRDACAPRAGLIRQTGIRADRLLAPFDLKTQLSASGLDVVAFLPADGG